MPTVPSQKYRAVLATVVMLSAALGSAVAFARPMFHPDADAHETSPGMFACDTEGFRFEYHAPTGREGLYDLRRDPDCVTNVLGDHEDVAARCRVLLAGGLHVERLDALRAGYADTIRRLQALGYL